MKLLVIYPYVPWPLDRGTYQRTFHLLKALAREHEVDFIALTESPGKDEAHRSIFEAFCRKVEFVPFQHPPWQKLIPDRLLNPLPNNVEHWQHDGVSKVVDDRLKPGHYDLVHICDLVLMPYVLGHRHHTPFVVDRSRVDLQFQWMEYKTLNFGLRRKLLSYEGFAKLWRYERVLARKAELEVVCGPDDRTFLHKVVSSKAPVKVVANGVDLDYFHPGSAKDPRDEQPTIMFCGAMDYSPNVDALRWYFGEVHARVMERMPDTQTLIVGRSPVEEVKAYGELEQVTVTGGVPDVRPYARLQTKKTKTSPMTTFNIVLAIMPVTPMVSAIRRYPDRISRINRIGTHR